MFPRSLHQTQTAGALINTSTITGTEIHSFLVVSTTSKIAADQGDGCPIVGLVDVLLPVCIEANHQNTGLLMEY